MKRQRSGPENIWPAFLCEREPDIDTTMNFLASKRLVTAALVLLALCNVTLLSVVLWQKSCGLRNPPGGSQYGHHRTFIESLALNKSQALSFSKLRQEHFNKVRPEMESIILLKKELVEESLKSRPEGNKIDTLVSRIGAHQMSIERELAFHFHELGKICTPTQCDSLKELLNQISAHKHAMRTERWIEHRP
ncbi:MAG: hypothetical protein WCG61_02450 [Chlorobium sp.]